MLPLTVQALFNAWHGYCSDDTTCWQPILLEANELVWNLVASTLLRKGIRRGIIFLTRNVEHVADSNHFVHQSFMPYNY